MLLEAVYHVARDNYAYAIDDDTIQVRIRTKKKDVQEIFVCAFDKYNYEAYNEKIKMNLEISDDLFDYYTVNVKPKYKRLSYYFEIIDNNRDIIYLKEYGFYSEIEKLQDFVHTGCFQFPFINKSDIFKTPKWLDTAVFYQVFPDRFNNGDKSNDPSIISKWGDKPKVNSYFGGDIIGIIKMIPYLKELGINALYLNPIFKAKSNHRYNTENYKEIDPILGNKGDLKKLITICHQNDIKLILDIPVNHTGLDFPPFADVIKNGKNSKYKDWFIIHDFPVITENGKQNYDTFSFEAYLPKLNMENDEVRGYFVNIFKYWIEQFKIDGVRLDVANEVPKSFWRIVRNELKKINKDSFILGEIWHDSMAWLNGDIFDSVTNFKFTDVTREFFASKIITIDQFKHFIGHNLISYPTNVSNVLLNSIGNHDIKRFLTECNGDINRFKQAIVFQMTFPGLPCIYYGDELMIEGVNDYDGRRCVNEADIERNKDMLILYKKLIELRKNQIALIYGDFKFIDIDNKDVLAYSRTYNNEKVLIFINNSKDNIKINSYEVKANGYKVIINEDEVL